MLAFSWGYEGWGSHTRELVEAVDAVEAARGFGPPVFVDIRYRREVRAAGFRGHAFEQLLGPNRYVWMRGLGNRAIADDSLGRITIDRPEDAAALLELISDRAPRRQRIIFFCSCGSPDARSTCHRGAVVHLLLVEAQRRQQVFSVQEWPGGSPLIAPLMLSAAELRRVKLAATSKGGAPVRLPVPEQPSIARAAALPHGSLLVCWHDADAVVAATFSAVCTARGWVFPVFQTFDTKDLVGLCDRIGDAIETMMLAPLGAPVEFPARWRLEDIVSGAPPELTQLPASVARAIETVRQPEPNVPRLGELVLACQIQCANELGYWVDHRAVWASPRDAVAALVEPTLVLAHGLTLEAHYEYYLDDDGDIRRFPPEIEPSIATSRPRSWIIIVEGAIAELEDKMIPGELEHWDLDIAPQGASPGDRIFVASSEDDLRILGLAEVIAVLAARKGAECDLRYLTLPLEVQPTWRELRNDPRLGRAPFIKSKVPGDVVLLSEEEAIALAAALASLNPTLRILKAWSGAVPEAPTEAVDPFRRIRESPNYVEGKGIRTLSVRQPWAWAILHAGKDVENRSSATNIRGTIAIHASKSPPEAATLHALRTQLGLEAPSDLPL